MPIDSGRASLERDSRRRPIDGRLKRWQTLQIGGDPGAGVSIETDAAGLGSIGPKRSPRPTLSFGAISRSERTSRSVVESKVILKARGSSWLRPRPSRRAVHP